MYKFNKQVYSLTLGMNAAKNINYIKKYLNKKYSELNFLQKPHWTHICISPRSGARDSKNFPVFKYYNALKLESRFTSGLNAAKNTDDVAQP